MKRIKIELLERVRETLTDDVRGLLIDEELAQEIDDIVTAHVHSGGALGYDDMLMRIRASEPSYFERIRNVIEPTPIQRFQAPIHKSFFVKAKAGSWSYTGTVSEFFYGCKTEVDVLEMVTSKAPRALSEITIEEVTR